LNCLLYIFYFRGKLIKSKKFNHFEIVDVKNNKEVKIIKRLTII